MLEGSERAREEVRTLEWFVARWVSMRNTPRARAATPGDNQTMLEEILAHKRETQPAERSADAAGDGGGRTLGRCAR
ncbi:MAG: hypothetical protein WKH64_15145 [Chloroflexia bacterium]